MHCAWKEKVMVRFSKFLTYLLKGTLSEWFRDLILTSQAKKALAHNNQIAWKRGLFRFNARRSKAIKEENESIFSHASYSIQRLSKRELLLVGSALYWGEGTLRERRNSAILSFSNSDAKMVRIFMRFVREVLAVPEKKIYSAIHIHPNIGELKARIFWGKVMRFPKEKFSIYRVISSAGKFKRPKHFLPYGTVNIRVNRRQLFYLIKGYIDGISKQLR